MDNFLKNRRKIMLRSQPSENKLPLLVDPQRISLPTETQITPTNVLYPYLSVEGKNQYVPEEEHGFFLKVSRIHRKADHPEASTKPSFPSQMSQQLIRFSPPLKSPLSLLPSESGSMPMMITSFFTDKRGSLRPPLGSPNGLRSFLSPIRPIHNFPRKRNALNRMEKHSEIEHLMTEQNERMTSPIFGHSRAATNNTTGINNQSELRSPTPVNSRTLQPPRFLRTPTNKTFRANLSHLVSDPEDNASEISPWKIIQEGPVKKHCLTKNEISKIVMYYRSRVASFTTILSTFLERRRRVDSEGRSPRMLSPTFLRKKFASLASPNASKMGSPTNANNGDVDLLNDSLGLLLKYVETHSKFKYRENIDFHNSSIKKLQQEISALPNQTKIMKKKLSVSALLNDIQTSDSDYSDDSDYDGWPRKRRKRRGRKRKRNRLRVHLDRAAWKRKHDADPRSKIFILIGNLPDLRESLFERGWVENEKKHSLIFDFKWTLKAKDIPHSLLQDDQIVNHFAENTSIVSKLGLCRNIRNLVCHHSTDPDIFLPRCYDINDKRDFADFIEEFKRTEAQCLLKRFVERKCLTSSLCKSSKQKTVTIEDRYKIWTAISILRRRLGKIDNVVLGMIASAKNCPLISMEEWKTLLSGHPTNKSLVEFLKDKSLEELEKEAFDVLQETKKRYPQYSIDGMENVWILKPANLSRGRGVTCFNSLPDIFKYCQKTNEVTWVAQKYIETPLLIQKRKFDIRQWVLVTDWNPLTVWFYGECYVRFSAEEYDTKNLMNRFVHLTNNSIAKHSEHFDEEIAGNMWSQAEFADHLKALSGRNVFFDDVQPKMQQYVIWSLLCVRDMVKSRKRSFELYGYDFMVDETLKPWLLEVNSSPAMEYSTKVTIRLVQMVLEDVVKVVIDYGCAKPKKKKKVDTGLFKMIYKGKPLI